jgi:hypothetical protein
MTNNTQARADGRAEGIREAAEVVRSSAYFTADEIKGMSPTVLLQEVATVLEDNRVHKIADKILALLDAPAHD